MTLLLHIFVLIKNQKNLHVPVCVFVSLLRRNMISVNVYKNVAFFQLICIFPEHFSEYVYYLVYSDNIHIH